MTDRKLEGKVAVVTGGGRGIGRAIAAACARDGAAVVICSRNRDHLEETARGLSRQGATAVALELDVRKGAMFPPLVELAEQKFGRVDILVNNAGISGITPLDEGDDRLWNDIIDTNLNGAYRATRHLLPLIPDGGRIINISSVLGKFGVAGYAAYCASKHGLIGFTRALSAELAPRKITVNAICPGWVDTDMARLGGSQIAARTGISEEKFWKSAMSRVPLGRFVELEEVAALALYLASPEAGAVTGQALNICGGATTN
ncbi:MAG: SDR family oxidoreductase [Acidobacteria bacterium]|nr:SDR family oxidoreductase [Acidobacteriota bacterium]